MAENMNTGKSCNNPTHTVVTNGLRDPSRRAFLLGVTTCALGVAFLSGFIPNLAAAQSKMTQKMVAYQDTPKGAQRCDKCSLFQPPNACKTVEGKISPQGWCSVFTPKV